jgi:tRNA pseudouridine32 synthase/23S rRNA pseudouridine746 synthase
MSPLASRRPEPPLPTLNGVSPSCVALPAQGPWPTLAAFLTHRFPAVPPEQWAERMAQGRVVDEHGKRVDAARPFQPHLRLYYYRAIDAEPRIPFDEVVLFQDAHLVAVDKPHFLPVTPGGRHLQETLLVRLKRRLRIDSLAPLHRLDRETAGVMLFSTRPATRGLYQALFTQRQMAKQYEAIAPWRADLSLPMIWASRLVEDTHFMRMREVPGEPNAWTRLALLARQGGLARYQLIPETGRKHQLRVHCAALGIPILHDRIYPRLCPPDTDDLTRPLQLLARSVAFADPLTGEARRFESQRQLDWPGAPVGESA